MQEAATAKRGSAAEGNRHAEARPAAIQGPASVRLDALSQVQNDNARVRQLSALGAGLNSGAAPQAVVQRVKIVRNPLTGADIDLHGMTTDELKALALALVSSSSSSVSGVPDDVLDEIQARKSDAAAKLPQNPGAFAAAGHEIIRARNDLRNDLQGVGAETLPLIERTDREEALGREAAGGIAKTAAGAAGSLLTGGLSGKVQSVVEALFQAGRAAQIQALADRAEGALADALDRLASAIGGEALAKGFSAVIPFLDKAAAKALETRVDDARDEIWYAAMDGDPVALEAASLLKIEVRQVAGPYGSAGTTLRAGVPQAGASAPSSSSSSATSEN